MKFIELHTQEGPCWINPNHIVIILPVKAPGIYKSAICVGWQADGTPITQTVNDAVEDILNKLATVHIGLN